MLGRSFFPSLWNPADSDSRLKMLSSSASKALVMVVKKSELGKSGSSQKKRLAPGGSSSATLIDIDLLTVLWPVGTGKVNISTAMTEKGHFYVPLLVSKAEPPQFGDFDCRYSSTIFKFFFIENIFEMLCSKTFELPFKKLILWIDTGMLFIAVPL